MSLRIVEHAGLTDVGRQRQSNEDRFVERPPFFAVADGMGGARGGEVASAMAVEAFDTDEDAGIDPEQRLAQIARAANRRIHDLSRSDERRAGMGTTFSAVMVGDHDIAVAHVGDSRVYRLREGDLERLTTDHSLVEEWVRAGRLTPEEAEHHPQRSIITRALGPERDVEVETCTYEAQDGDCYLLCSDGLTGMVAEEEIVAVLERSRSLDDAARELVASANAAGGRDNITVVLVRVGHAGATAAADEDTLSGRETQAGGLSATEVHDALAAAERDTGRTAGPAPDDTVAIDAAAVRSAREQHAAPPPAGREPERPAPARREPPARDRAAAPGGRGRPRPRRRGRRLVPAVVALFLLSVIAAGVLLASRQAYFLGTGERGLVTLYRGLPYDLPLGLELYSTEYESSVPAGSLTERQRGAIFDHDLRSRDDATDLVRQLEQGRTVGG